MIITMDVVFYEDKMYFPSKSELQGELHQEIQTSDYKLLEYDYHSPMEHNPGTIGNQGVDNLDLSGITLDQSGDECSEVEAVAEIEGEEVTKMEGVMSSPSLLETCEAESLTDIPHQSPVENVPILKPEPTRKQLPQCHNRGIPKPTYEPVFSSTAKYPMRKYVSSHHLSESKQSFLN